MLIRAPYQIHNSFLKEFSVFYDAKNLHKNHSGKIPTLVTQKYPQNAVCHGFIDLLIFLIGFTQSQTIKIERKMLFHDLELYSWDE